MTDAERRALAAEIETAAKTARAAGDTEWALRCFEWALRLRAQDLPDAESLANLQPVTGAQLQRRGRAIAKGRAASSKDPLLQAIAASQWGSQERYAKRLGVSAGSLNAYRNGLTPCPKSIADRIEKDLGIGDDYWRKPRSVVE